MNTVGVDIMSPDLLPRVRGGFLALSERAFSVRIGATGLTEAEARDTFKQVAEVYLRARDAEQSQQ